MNTYKSFAITVIGNSHTKQGLVCQDASFKYDNDKVSIAVVADGHGDSNCFRSDKGSKLAVACAAKGLEEFVVIHEQKFSKGHLKKKNITSKNDFDKSIRDLVKFIIASWQVKVEEDYTANPFSQKELELADEKHRKKYEAGIDLNKAYGTTLIAAAITDDYWFGIHIGDGRFTALYPDGSCDQPVPWDEKCYLNVTTSICDDNALEQARIYFSFNELSPPPVAVFICTDGIDDNYPVDENEKHLFKLYRTIALTFVNDDFDSTYNQMIELVNAFATKGKGDDTSIAGFINMKKIKKTEPIWLKQIAEEEKTVAEKIEDEEQAQNNKSGTEELKVTASKKALEAITAYEKNNSTKRNILNYGGFVSGNKKM